ncbi:nuclease domain-containing protein [Trinickia dinghuensis]|uniref:DUF1364 family protein n=1 Tax=Trinickia dinghuensis TaxID=2291023 RepID=A0A3D8K2W1_9BURK|nr:nuclease domain-containing protein [Trinickia dinghuensis]RDU99215.1 DUF1364 family protein [Trinickia dinghuensis]
MLTRKKPLQRTAFAPRQGASSLLRTTPLRNTPFKRKARKKRAWHDKKMLDVCRGQICYLRVPGTCPCREPEETIVPCHSNFSEHGKGGARKADDKYTVPGCFWCHAWFDTGGAPLEQKREVFDIAYSRWSRIRDAVEMEIADA